MRLVNIDRIFSTRLLRKPDALAVSALLLLFAPLAQAAQPPDALQFHKSYFLNGGHPVVGGVGLRGQGVPDALSSGITGVTANYATGTINMSGLPANADIEAAYLYWETLESTTPSDSSSASLGVFRGQKISGKYLGPSNTGPIPACFGSGGGAGNQSGAQNLGVYRADVLKLLPIQRDANGKVAGRRIVNDSDLLNSLNNVPSYKLPSGASTKLTTVSLMDSGGGGTTSNSSGNQVTYTEGASLVIVYRIPSLSWTAFSTAASTTLVSIGVAGTTATVTTALPHGLQPGYQVMVSGATTPTIPNLNGTDTIQTVPSATTFTITVSKGAAATYNKANNPALSVYSSSLNAPLRAVVIYDGAFTFNGSDGKLEVDQALGGFYDASATSPKANITYIVGNGRANFQELLYFTNNKTNTSTLLATTPDAFLLVARHKIELVASARAAMSTVAAIVPGVVASAASVAVPRFSHASRSRMTSRAVA